MIAPEAKRRDAMKDADNWLAMRDKCRDPVVADGNCLFNALVEGWNKLGYVFVKDGKPFKATAFFLRKEVCKHLAEHHVHFRQFFDIDAQLEMHENFENYLKHMKKSGE